MYSYIIGVDDDDLWDIIEDFVKSSPCIVF